MYIKLCFLWILLYILFLFWYLLRRYGHIIGFLGVFSRPSSLPASKRVFVFSAVFIFWPSRLQLDQKWYNYICVQVPASPVQLSAGKEESRFQERRLQRHTRERGQETTTLPARHLHNACRRTVAMDSPCVRPQLLTVLARVRDYLVAHRIFTWRP
jgi:hypothetical protein